MINENKEVVLIDFNSLIEYGENKDIDSTLDFATTFFAPEVAKTKKFTYESEIYSLGKIIEYIMVSVGYDKLIYKSNEYKAFEEIIIRCTYENPKNRSSIFDIINYYTLNFNGKFQLEKLYSRYEKHFHNLDKIILIIQKYKNKKDPLSIFNFGVMYFE